MQRVANMLAPLVPLWWELKGRADDWLRGRR
jgi:hypothetical protein